MIRYAANDPTKPFIEIYRPVVIRAANPTVDLTKPTDIFAVIPGPTTRRAIVTGGGRVEAIVSKLYDLTNGTSGGGTTNNNHTVNQNIVNGNVIHNHAAADPATIANTLGELRAEITREMTAKEPEVHSLMEQVINRQNEVEGLLRNNHNENFRMNEQYAQAMLQNTTNLQTENARLNQQIVNTESAAQQHINNLTTAAQAQVAGAMSENERLRTEFNAAVTQFQNQPTVDPHTQGLISDLNERLNVASQMMSQVMPYLQEAGVDTTPFFSKFEEVKNSRAGLSELNDVFGGLLLQGQNIQRSRERSRVPTITDPFVASVNTMIDNEVASNALAIPHVRKKFTFGKRKEEEKGATKAAVGKKSKPEKKEKKEKKQLDETGKKKKLTTIVEEPEPRETVIRPASGFARSMVKQPIPESKKRKAGKSVADDWAGKKVKQNEEVTAIRNGKKVKQNYKFVVHKNEKK